MLSQAQVVKRLEASVKALAADVDDPRTRPTARAIAARELRETLTHLHRLAPAQPKADKLDELARKRNRRRAAS